MKKVKVRLKKDGGSIMKYERVNRILEPTSLNVLSTFDGMSCGQVALIEAGIKFNKYYASEIDKFAIKQTQLNFPNTIQVGDVSKCRAQDLEIIDLLIGGSPCQGFSFAGNQLNFEDPRSILFFEFVRLWKEIKEINPDAKFLLENVNMKKKHLAVITKELGVYPVRIDSNLVSAQNRDRWYWTNIKTERRGLFNEIFSSIEQPLDKRILLKDIIEETVDDKYYMPGSMVKKAIEKHGGKTWKSGNRMGSTPFPTDINGKSKTIKSTNIATNRETTHIGVVHDRGEFREIEKSMCVDANYHKGMDDHGQRTIIQVSGKNVIIDNKTKPPFALREERTSEGKRLRSERMKNGKRDTTPRNANSKKFVPIDDGKTNTVTRPRGPFNNIIDSELRYRRLTPLEYSRLQTVPEWYKWECSDTQQYKMLGNGWTIEVIKHIFKHLEK